MIKVNSHYTIFIDILEMRASSILEKELKVAFFNFQKVRELLGATEEKELEPVNIPQDE